MILILLLGIRLHNLIFELGTKNHQMPAKRIMGKHKREDHMLK